MQRLLQFGLGETVPEAVGAQQENVAIFQLQYVAVGGVAFFIQPSAKYSRLLLMPLVW
ncbi:Uncharacterised protein [Serratia rubidaea]|uniref:Uncharacterized protein n=1 Tax=Serratia rubidaea TaxID=61652 RepID=A0A447QD78_SERRU|nr:Uncharacterised protein [Serratia rubidaea]